MPLEACNSVSELFLRGVPTVWSKGALLDAGNQLSLTNQSPQLVFPCGKVIPSFYHKRLWHWPFLHPTHVSTLSSHRIFTLEFFALLGRALDLALCLLVQLFFTTTLWELPQTSYLRFQ